MKKNILGLDLGTNSIGWALVEQNPEEGSGKIIKAGTRIIPMSQDVLGKFDSGQSISQTAERTGYRGIRRLRERHLLRRERLHRVLNILGFLPKHYQEQIDFDNRLGQFLPEKEPKIPYAFNLSTNKYEFLFKNSFYEMLQDFSMSKPELLEDKHKVPYDWTIYYLRKKALTNKIEKEELTWLLLNFNQKRGYYQLRGEEEQEGSNKKVEYYALQVIKVEDSGDKQGKDGIWYNVHLENGWIYRRSSKVPLDWEGKIKEFIVTTELNDDGSVKTDKEGNEKRSFRAPAENDWNLVKNKTEQDIKKSKKTVGEYIYDSLLNNPDQKIKGKLVRVIERKFYKEELKQILEKQKEFHSELRDVDLYNKSVIELYRNNEVHRRSINQRGFTYLFLEDIIFFQRPLKSKTALISDCRFESASYIKDGVEVKKPAKCIAKSHPLFQEFRLWQFIQNLRIYQKDKVVDGKLVPEVDVTSDFLTFDDDWVNLFKWLNERKEVDQKGFFKYAAFNLKRNELQHYRWNYVEDKIYPCNETRNQMISLLSKAGVEIKEFLTKDKEEALWHILYSIVDKEELRKALQKFARKNGFSEELAKVFVSYFEKFPPFKKDYGSYSAKAIKKLLPLMRTGCYWNEENIDLATRKRIDKILDGEYDDKLKTRVREKSIHFKSIQDFTRLPLWLASYIVYDRHSEDGDAAKWKSPSDMSQYLDEVFKQHSLRNPIVEQVITETLRVVRDVWTSYGGSRPDFFSEIHIELGREMKNPADRRKRMTNQITENENTNLRIKALLMELKNDSEFENIRPFSPGQQEILKIFEEGALGSDEEVPDEILKISKLAHPTSSELVKYKLWLQQRYRSPYTGEVIPLNKLFTPAYEIEHIIPQSRYFDDSFSNKVICEAAVNKDKGNKTAFEYILNEGGKIIELGFGKTVKVLEKDAYEKIVQDSYAKNPLKKKKLLMEDIPEDFIQRQLNDSRYISKVVKNLLSNIVREEEEQEVISKNVVATNGGITSKLKQDWGLNDIWNQIITPRFERMNEITKTDAFGYWTSKGGKKVFQVQVPLEHQKGFNKKRIDHRHHALDAIIIACTTRSHINYLNNLTAIGKGISKQEKEKRRFDLRQKLCVKNYNAGSKEHYKWMLKKPWQTFPFDAKECLESIVVSHKQNLRVINKTVNYYTTWGIEADGDKKLRSVKQVKGENWAIRKALHKDTVSGQVHLKLKKEVSFSTAMDNYEMLCDKELKTAIKDLISQGYDKKKVITQFKSNGFNYNGHNISRVEIFYWDDSIVASRVSIDETFTASKINSITDSGIRKMMLNHLSKYNEIKSGKIVEHPELAFSVDGVDEMNRNIVQLNEGKKHKPIYKVRTFEPLGTKFRVGTVGNKKDKFVEAAKGTNLFFAIYCKDDGRRCYESIPLNIVIERLKQGLTAVPEKNEIGNNLLFNLSPNDLVYVPTEDELESEGGLSLSEDTLERTNRIYKVVSFSGTQCFFVKNDVAFPIVNKVEFSPLNKMERSIDGTMIKDVCVKVRVDRLGQIQIA